MMAKKGQIWIETVIYTLIGLTIIGLMLSIVIPKIEEKKDQLIIEHSIAMLNAIGDVIEDVRYYGVGNAGEIEVKIKKGKLIVDSKNNEIKFFIESRHMHSEPNVTVSVGKIKVLTIKKGNKYEVNLTLKYDNVNISWNGGEIIQIFNPAPTPYRLIITNLGKEPTNIDFSGLGGTSHPSELKIPTTYYPNSKGNECWWVGAESFPSGLSWIVQTALTSTELNTISVDDDNYATSRLSEMVNGIQIRFEILGNVNNIDNITINFIGNTTDRNSGEHEFQLKLWNHTAGDWTEMLAIWTGAKKGSVSYIITDPYNFISDSGDLYAFAGDSSSDGYPVEVNVFYAKLKVATNS
jgi:hypothetical protein